MALVLSTHPLHPRAAETIEAVATLRIATSLVPDRLTELAHDADIVIVRSPLPSTLFAHAPRLRAAIRHGAGIDMIPVEAATAAGVLVANVPGTNARSVAEYVILCMIALARRFRGVDHDLRTKGWNEARGHAIATTEISGKTLGLIGMGHVGRELARLASAFDMSVVAFRPSAATMPVGAARKPLEDVIAEADFLVLCCSLTAATRGLMSHARLALMKPTAYLINVARGPVVVEADLLAALQTGALAGAALDVFDQQPLSPDHNLFECENVILTPHLAGITEDSMYRMGMAVAHECLRVLRAQLPSNLINPAAVPVYRSRFGGFSS